MLLLRGRRVGETYCVVLKVEVAPFNLGDWVFAGVVPNCDRSRVRFMIHSEQNIIAEIAYPMEPQVKPTSR